MSKRLLSLLLIFLPTFTFAQVFETVPILNNGSPDQRINFVFLSDGYQQNELEKFEVDVRKVVDNFFSQSPLQEYKAYFNVYAVKVPSEQSGANHPASASDESSSNGQPRVIVNNYFGSTFDYANIHRLLVTTNTVRISNVLAANLPQYDQVFILVNTSYYGGSGGLHATSSTNIQAGEIAIHEIGHSFARASDEYWVGAQYARESPNMTQQASPTMVKWKNWYNLESIGIYPHSENPAWYRPHNTCKMRYLGYDFCAVCKETFVERIHQLVPSLESWEPANTSVTSEAAPIRFSVNVLAPTPNTMAIEWKLNGNSIQRRGTSLELNPALLRNGKQTLTASVVDSSGLTREDTHKSVHFYSVSWEITHTPLGISTNSFAQNMSLSAYPNPATDLIKVEYTLEAAAPVEFELLTLSGKRVSTQRFKKQTPGDHHLEIPMQKLAPNIYLLKVYLNGTSFTQRIMKL